MWKAFLHSFFIYFAPAISGFQLWRSFCSLLCKQEDWLSSYSMNILCLLTYFSGFSFFRKIRILLSFVAWGQLSIDILCFLNIHIMHLASGIPGFRLLSTCVGYLFWFSSGLTLAIPCLWLNGFLSLLWSLSRSCFRLSQNQDFFLPLVAWAQPSVCSFL